MDPLSNLLDRLIDWLIIGCLTSRKFDTEITHLDCILSE
jgi:hypothetical protein